MAGSYNHCINEETLDLLPWGELEGMIENMGDAGEAIEEMVFMIKWLAKGDKALIEQALKAFYAYSNGKWER